MRIELESTTKMVEIVVDGVSVPARIWEGHTANGIACHAYITRIAVRDDRDCSEFDRDLQETRSLGSPDLLTLPARFVL